MRGCVLRLLVNRDARRLLATSSVPAQAADQSEYDYIEGRLQEAARAYADGLITMPQMTAITEALRDKRTAIQAGAVDASRSRILGDQIAIEDLVTRWDRELSLALKRSVIDTLMTITVRPVGRGAKDFRAGVDIRLKSDVATAKEDLVSTCLFSRLDEVQEERIGRLFSA